MDYRTGIGWDVHRTASGRALVLGGVRIEADYGLVGHSDADVLLHAITDAVLGALGLGDIGTHFPDNDPRWAGAASDQFLRYAVEEARSRGYQVVHIDSTVILERPKLKPYRERIRARIAEIAGVEPERVSVKFKTAEGLGPVGEGLSVEAQAVVTLARQ